MKKDKYVVFLPKGYGIFTGKGANLAHSRTLAEKYEFVWQNIFYFHFPLQSSKYPDLLTTMLSSCHTLYWNCTEEGSRFVKYCLEVKKIFLFKFLVHPHIPVI